MSDIQIEIKAMSAIGEALIPLDEAGRRRVLTWANSHFGGSAPRLQRDPTAQQAEVGDSGFNDFVDLYDAASPDTESDRALVAGYWFQVVDEQPTWESSRLNNALKDLGHGVGNITRALDRLQERNPSFVRQVGKSGRSKQARKTYKLTTAGVTAVKDMLAESDSNDE